MSFRTYKRDVNPFEVDTEGRLFVVVDVSKNWATDRNWQTNWLIYMEGNPVEKC